MNFSHKVLTIVLKNIFVKRSQISFNIFWWFLMFFWSKRKLKSAARDPPGLLWSGSSSPGALFSTLWLRLMISDGRRCQMSLPCFLTLLPSLPSSPYFPSHSFPIFHFPKSYCKYHMVKKYNKNYIYFYFFY